ncbi:hypothetical protein THAOC_14631 [Thalassiosira oceanica]|uniref:Uncharacterized protein n=1 Tax=Thalassiosira oceanica TaxID=159749 RepID=K0SET0_THAOC|nr:hypothetical protein THAOC_14631 [Thalassiosira oceanica]|eukprot:EJK64618.1 hypothetical protein THAOC_14631 [Thalassiosira oceanica]
MLTGGLLLSLLSASLPTASRGFVPPSGAACDGVYNIPTPTAGRRAAPPLRSTVDGELAIPADEGPAATIVGLVKPETAESPTGAATSADALRLGGQYRRTTLLDGVSADSLVNSLVLLSAVTLVAGRFLSVDLGLTRGWTPLEVAERVPLDNWRGYNEILTAAPVQTKALTSASVYTIGDIIAQTRQGSGMGDLDRPRIVRSMIAGLVGHGPMSHLWYRWSEAFFDKVVHLPHAWWDFVPKVCADQLVFGPLWNNTFILLIGFMQLNSPGMIWDEMRRTTVPLLLSGLKLWPFVHIVTYGVIPVENRLLWVDAVEIVWVTILASVANEGGEGEEGQRLNQEDVDDVR